MKLKYNPKAIATPRWGVRVYHAEHSKCLKVEGTVTETIPKGFFPCEHCFPCNTKIRKELNKL
jgi:hypothetical protein